MIRNARCTDIPALVALLGSAYDRSHYAGTEVEIDEKETKRLLVQSIQRHGHKVGGGCFVQVAESHGIVTGLILGTLVRVYVIGNRLMATDLFWVCSSLVEPGDPARLVGNMLEWARTVPHVVEVRCGTTAVIQDPEKAGNILTRLGMEQYGTIYRKELMA